jgi:serine/threonine-protein kinase
VTPEQWARIKSVFAEASERPPGERAAFLNRACGDDAVLRREVESLLAAEADASGFLDTPAAVLGAPTVAQPSVLASGQTIGRYRVLSLLGAGGMGEVYLAVDERLRRRIALKLLPRRLSSDPDRLRRFEQEARTASALSHPNVRVIHEVGETEDGRRFIAMEYVEGETLRERLARARAAGTGLPLREAVDVAQQISAGLAAAHDAGVVHRDVKPENIVVRSDGLVKVLDFGLAKLAERAPDERGNTNSAIDTEPGMVLGTVQYMSPEQARGLPMDARTDVWSLGAVLYEMVAGRPPFDGETTSDVMVAVLEREPPPLDVAPEVPDELRHVITTAMRKRREERYETANAMELALKRLQRRLEAEADQHERIVQRSAQGSADGPDREPRRTAPDAEAARRGSRRVSLVAALVLSVLVGAGGFAGWWRARATAASTVEPSAPAPVRLAVLPFENLGRPEDAYFADGMADEVRGKLAGLPGVEVIARSSSAHYRGNPQPAHTITQELGVQYLLTATVQWLRAPGRPERVLVRPELVQVVDGRPVTRWQQSFDAVVADVFAVQAEIAQRATQALDLELGTAQRSRLAERPTNTLSAYDAFLRGEQAWRAAEEVAVPQLLPMLRDFERAVTLDPDFLVARVRLVQAQAVVLGNAPAEARRAGITREAVREGGERALELSRGGPEGHLALGYYYGLVESENVRALEQFTLGLRAAPNDGELLMGASLAEMSLGRWSDALGHLRQAALLDPRNGPILATVGYCLSNMRRYQEAQDAFARALALQPSYAAAATGLAMTALAQGDLAEARAVYRRAVPTVGLETLVGAAGTQHLGWSLDDDLRLSLEKLRPDAFGGDRVSWALALADAAALRGDTTRSQAFADSARAAAGEVLIVAPNDATMRSLQAIALARLGRREDAVREGWRALALWPIARDLVTYHDLRQRLARVYILVGAYEDAIDTLEPLLQAPYYLSPGWLRIDPTFAPLRGHPRFERLAGGGRQL